MFFLGEVRGDDMPLHSILQFGLWFCDFVNFDSIDVC